jgi:hypothetical protein
MHDTTSQTPSVIPEQLARQLAASVLLGEVQDVHLGDVHGGYLARAGVGGRGSAGGVG